MPRLVVAVAMPTLLLATLGQAAPPAFPIEASLSTNNRWNAFTSDEAWEGKAPCAIALALKNRTGEPQRVQCALEVRDYFGALALRAPTATRSLAPHGSDAVKLELLPRAYGAYDVAARLTCAEQTAETSLTFIVVPPPHAGLRPESFFASNTDAKDHPDFHQKIGLKVYRQHFADMWRSLAAESRGERRPSDPIAFDFAETDRYLAECRSHGISVLGIVGYANPEWARTAEAQRLGMYGPPRDLDEFLRATIPVVQRYREIRTWEFWNEPWIYGWTWAGSAAEYRRFQQAWIEAAKRARPDLRVIVGHSASFLADNIAPDPSCYAGLVDADSNHPYKEGERPNLRRGSQLRYIDYGVQQARRMGIEQHFVTENGTEVPGARDHRLNAPKIVVMHVMAALAGEYQMNVQEGIGWGLDQLRGAAAYAVMTHFLEDRVPVADLWPSHPLLGGAIFAAPEFADRSFPRASELAARWGVPGRPGDQTKVAVVWSYTGPDENHLDDKATFTVSPAGDLRAYDLMGNPTGRRSSDGLTVPFSQYPVYLTSDALTVRRMWELVREGRAARATPVNLYVLSPTRPVAEKPDLVVRLQNQLNRPLTATVELTLPAGWVAREREQRVKLEPAQLADVAFHLKSARTSATNLYAVTVRVKTEAGTASRTQVIQAAYAPRRSVVVDGRLDDWSGVTPVTIDSDWLGTGEDWTYRALNPNLPRPAAAARKPRVVARCRTAWDDANVYLYWEVQEPALKQEAGTPAKGTRYLTGALDGLGFPFYTGDAIEFVFGVRDRAEDDYRRPEDPWYWKGCFRDTDYQYVAFSSAQGPQLLRLHRPGLPYRVGFQTETPEGQGPVTGSRIAITRTGEVTCYELSLPRAQLEGLDPEAGRPVRFGFVVANDEGAGSAGRLQWSEAAGVFDYWFNNGSYQPTWESFWAAQTPWGFGP